MSAKILVIEDEPLIRELLYEFLTGLGYNVVLAENGEKAIKLCADRQIKLALVDFKLPDMDGLEVVNRLCQQNPSLVNIIVTAYPTKKIQTQAQNKGIYAYLTKPFRLPELQSLIEKALKES
ncbi:MAG: hypothetical protein A2142_09070 [candidate division Zixibacteria bacterium RBG_16_48_11]|nr:MAG: hypothetical protein A2142_09070 [candidate division Zixibacteria bacterium RBG_16_48_11]